MGRTAPTLRTSSTPATLLLLPTALHIAQTSIVLTRRWPLRVSLSASLYSEKRFMCSGVHAHKQAPQALGAEGALARLGLATQKSYRGLRD